ncbi:MAG: carbohydrate ABC transporter substrate-binding protein [Lachnospiraceae bacterium]|nr:carbohydrate ABC transporter substrate-binding protein [Lachnospiraceae bacterium]
MQKRSKVWQICAMTLVGMLVLSSCGGNAGQQKVEELTQKLTQKVSLEEIDLDSLDVSEGGWRDNSLDLYSATSHYELKRSYPEDAAGGGGAGQLVADTRAYRMKKHLLMDAEKSWDEVSFVTADGVDGSRAFTSRTEQVWAIGVAAGTDDILLETITPQEDGACVEHHVILLDKDMNRKQDILLPFLDGEDYIIFNTMRMDVLGNLHLIYEADSKHYVITDSKGEILNDYEIKGSNVQLYFTTDGQVALKMQERIDKKEKFVFLQYDVTMGKMETLSEFEKEDNRNIQKAICTDKDTIIFTDSVGVYKSNPKNIQEATLLYEWQKHGMLVTNVWDVQYLEGNRISLLYGEGDKMYYLNLEPTTEQVPIQRIAFAIPSHKKSIYEKAVIAFNKKYPAYYMELKRDYDQTALLTELMAGNGPVLIDTQLTGFEEQKELWLPLDKILEKLKLNNELLLPVMEQGNIDGQLYGLVRDFRIQTVITVGDEARDWDYDMLTREILENKRLTALTDSVSCDGGWSFVAGFLMHGLEENYFIDANTQTTRFREPQTQEILENVKRFYTNNERLVPGQGLEEGKVLCNPVTISRPEQLALYRLYYGEKLQYSGYPTKNGGKHFLRSDEPITIRKNASKEEVTAACLFLKILLSYEVQVETIKDSTLSFSVRKDVLEEQWEAMDEQTDAYALGIEQIQLGDGVDVSKDKETLEKLLENAVPVEYLPRELLSIFLEEMTRYFDNEITLDMALEHLENRVQLYLDENQ